MSLLILFAGAGVGVPPSGPAYGLDDLTTMWTFYERDTILALPGFVNEDWRAYLDGVRASTGEVDDLNTAVYKDLKT